MKKFLLALTLITIQHTCVPGDTLQSIAEQYCLGNYYKQVGEFREGIRELNYSVLGESEVWSGLELIIHRWE